MDRVLEKRVKDFPGAWREGWKPDPCDDKEWKRRFALAKKLVKKHRATGAMFNGWFKSSEWGDGKLAVGYVYADLKMRFPSGWRIWTSKVVKKSKKTEDGYYIVQTLNSTYLLFPASKPSERAPG